MLPVLAPHTLVLIHLASVIDEMHCDNPKPARPLSPAEREDNIQKRQRPAEVNTVLTIARAYNGNEITTLTEDQNALHTGQIWCGGGGRQAAIETSSLGTLGIKTETGRIIQSETGGTRI